MRLAFRVIQRAVSTVLLATPLLAQAGKQPSAKPRFEFRDLQLGDSISKLPHADECTPGEERGQVRCTYLNQSIGGQSVSIAYEYLDGRLFDVLLVFNPFGFADLETVLRARYGVPSRTSAPAFRTIGGAQTSNQVLTWQFRDGEFTVRRYNGSLTNGTAHISADLGFAEYAKRRRERLRDAATHDLSAQATTGQLYFEFQVEKQVQQIPGTGNLRYPDMLRSANVEGEVLAQFVVDENGRYELGTFKVIKSSHDLFTQAVKNALPNMRFYPAEVGGKKVRQLVQQPFTFSLSKG